MNNDPTKRTVRISYAGSDEVRLSEPVPVHATRPTFDAAPPAQPPLAESKVGETADASSSLASGSAGQPMGTDTDQNDAAAPGTEAGLAVADAAVTVGAATAAGQKSPGAGKSKVDIETLAQFIEYVYGRKGQRVTLKPKVEKQIAQNPTLDNAAMNRLLTLAEADTLLAVPRQLLLVSRDIVVFPALRAALASFVATVMHRHSAFAEPGVQGALRNLPEAISPSDALTRLATFVPADEDDKDALKGAELQALRRNATHLFATWLASNRGMTSEELSALLFQVMWLPAARELADDNARLRALTEVEHPAGVGLACLRFREQGIEASSSRDQALREANELRMRLADAEAQRIATEEQLDTLESQLQALRESTAAELADLRQQHEVERTHLRHDQEQLRGRLLHRLDDGVEMLEVGLTALRNKTPRVEVMMERAEHVVDALRVEMKNLREE